MGLFKKQIYKEKHEIQEAPPLRLHTPLRNFCDKLGECLALGDLQSEH